MISYENNSKSKRFTIFSKVNQLSVKIKTQNIYYHWSFFVEKDQNTKKRNNTFKEQFYHARCFVKLIMWMKTINYMILLSKYL